MKANLPQKENEWQTIQDRLADENGMAIVVVDENSSALTKSNNNSMCRLLYNSKEFSPLCAEFCGRAYEWATEAQKTVEYKCHAGLNCRAVPLETEQKTLVAIVGRTFLKAEDYRTATERAISGDWQKFPANEFFENILLNPSALDLERISAQLKSLTGEEAKALEKFIAENAVDADNSSLRHDAEDAEKAPLPESALSVSFTQENEKKTAIANEFVSSISPSSESWRSFFAALVNKSYKQACSSILQFVANRYQISDLAWLESRESAFEITASIGKLKEKSIQINLASDDKRLLEAVQKETSLELRGRQSEDESALPEILRLFPIMAGNEIQSAIAVGSDSISGKTNLQLARFCRRIAPQLEILRLREEILRRGLLARAINKFNEVVKNADSQDFWTDLAQISAELMRAGRSSLLVFNDKTDSLKAKAATGARADFIKAEGETLGARVARKVLQSGEPLVVESVEKTVIKPAPEEWSYESDSFISYPIVIGGQKIGVLNLTDRTNNEIYKRSDLELLNAIMPQIALLIDRASLQHLAGEFEQLSVTDALTGLLNRRYLEERLAEEIKRSNRHGFPMSFMMIDVDDFKAYNDNFTHPEGDRALQIVGQCLRETLRGADVAVRYGGEEFSILLPQTTSEEAETIAERVREKIESTDFPKRRVTVSIGITSCSQILCTPQKMISAADEALYEAKRRGRNNVQVYEKLKKEVSRLKN